MSQIQIQNLTFCYEGSSDPVFEHLTLALDTDWRLGLIGRNGRGKTTLLRLLCGQLDAGSALRTPISCDYFPFNVSDPSLPATLLGQQLAPGCAAWELSCEWFQLGFDEGRIQQPFHSLSGGEQTRLLLGILFARSSGHFLLIDEPTNHLDAEGRQIVSDYLSSKQGFLLVSHDRVFLDGCIDHVLAFQRTGLEVQAGNFSTWWNNRQQRDAAELAQNARLHKEIDRLQAAARRTAGWSDAVERTKLGGKGANGLRPDRGAIGHKAAKMMKRAKAITARREKAIQEKSSLLLDLETTDALMLHPLSHHASHLIEAKDLSVCFGTHVVFSGLNFEIRSGERIALTGANGCGKSTLMRCLIGTQSPNGGSLQRASGLRISYVPQDTSDLRGSLRSYADQYGIDYSRFLTLLRKLGFERTQFEKDLAQYSAGQRKKAALARSLCEEAHLYLWDEPLNYIDIFTRMQLEDLLIQTQATMLFVEHDQAFTQKTATRTLTL